MTELRLAGASTLPEANRVLWGYLPRFNERFGVPPTQEGSAYRLLPPELDLSEILCFNHTREAPPRKGMLRDGNGSRGQQTSTDWARFAEQLAALLPSAEDSCTVAATPGRKPTLRMQAYWEAVQEAKSRGLSFRAIVTELGIARNTVSVYANAPRPPVYGERSA